MSKASQEKQRRYEAVHGLQNLHNRTVNMPPTQAELDRDMDRRDARRRSPIEGGMSMIAMLPLLAAMSSVGYFPIHSSRKIF